VQALRNRGRRSLPPELGDQPVSGDDLVGVQQQYRQQCSPLAGTDGYRPTVVVHLEWTE
jgi:hypothetical protein